MSSYVSNIVFILTLQEDLEKIEKKRLEEEEQTSGVQGVLNSINVSEELAGDAKALKEPGMWEQVGLMNNRQ